MQSLDDTLYCLVTAQPIGASWSAPSASMKAWNPSLAKDWATAGRPVEMLSGFAGVLNCTQPSRSCTGICFACTAAATARARSGSSRPCCASSCTAGHACAQQWVSLQSRSGMARKLLKGAWSTETISSQCWQSLCQVFELSYSKATCGAVLFWLPHCMTKDSATAPLQLCAVPR